MQILVLGGTRFIGPHVVEALQVSGHHVTVFNRGQTPDALQGVSHLRGDRVSGEVSALQGLSFDATIDMSAYFPRAVNQVLEVLADPGFYCLVSSISAYASMAAPDQDESAPLATVSDPATEDPTGGDYGGLKVLCEQALSATSHRHAIVRPGLVVGPGDHTDRFTYWPVRASEGGPLLAPGSPDDPVQWVDARDFAAFVRLLVESGTSGMFNVVTPPRTLTMGGLMSAISTVLGRPLDLTWLPAGRLGEFGLQPWADLPAWLPPEGDYAGAGTFSTAVAQAAGLVTRPLEETVADVLGWWRGLPEARRRLRTGLSREQMNEVLTAF
ncbi:MAG: NAD-dependent epimerase/dehydratase family protein [Bradymonadia bacterium]